VEDDARYIQAVTLQLYQVDKLQESKEKLLRNNYGKKAINNELSSALHSTGAQHQMQSQVQEHSNDEARGPSTVSSHSRCRPRLPPVWVRSATPRRPVIIGH